MEANSLGLGRGSEFVVRLPLVAKDSVPVEAPAKPSEQSASTQGHRILLIDDNVDSAEAMGVLLQMFGHEVRKALDGPSALNLANEFRPQIVLCDIGLPGMDGYEVVRRLRKVAGEVQPIVAAITGYGQAEDRHRSQEAGFDYHLVKPVDWKALEAVINSVGRGSS